MLRKPLSSRDPHSFHSQSFENTKSVINTSIEGEARAKPETAIAIAVEDSMTTPRRIAGHVKQFAAFASRQATYHMHAKTRRRMVFK